MKRISVILVIILAGLGGIRAQKKNVDAAMKLVGKTESVVEARRLLKEAMMNERTDSQARTYYVAGLVEWRSYEADVRKKEINPADGSVKAPDMAAKMLNGYRHFLKALEFDSLPDKKGRVRPKYSREILGLFDSHVHNLYRAGAVYYNDRKYFPEAYEAFIGSADLARDPCMSKSRLAIPDSVVRDAYYFAGLSAYAAGRRQEALSALGKAREAGMTDADLYLYQMAIWEQLARDSAQLEKEARDALLAISREGYRRYGVTYPAFLSRMAQILMAEKRHEEVIAILDRQIAATPDSWLAYGLRGWANEQRDHDVEAVNDYKRAAALPGISSRMLTRGAHYLFRFARAQKNLLSGPASKRRAIRAEIIKEYLNPAMEMSVRAKEMTHEGPELGLINNLIENIDYEISLLK